MARALTLSKAANLVGIARGELQKMIRDGSLYCYDGLIDLDELRRVFPQARIEDSGLLERVKRIRDESFGRRVRERALPPAEILAERLFLQSQELADLRRHLQAYHQLVSNAISTLDVQTSGDQAATGLRQMLESGLAKVLASEPSNPLDAMTDMLNVVCANVTVRPSGHDFLVEGNDSILQAALKAGLGLNYGCGSGNCGLCKARVVSGEVREVMHSDYRLSQAEQQQGWVLLCSHTALSDLVIETLEARGPADIPEQQIVAKVKSLQPLGQDTLLLHLQTPRSTRLRFLAGQSVTLGLAHQGQNLQANYPIASCPCDDRNLLIHLARDPLDGLAQLAFSGGLKAQDNINLRGPTGDFVLGANVDQPVVFLACDTGFAPVKSLIEHVIATESVESFELHWLATRGDGHYQANLCASWVDAFDNFAFHMLADAQPAAGGMKLTRQACEQPHRPDTVYFVSGPSEFVEACQAELTLLDVDDSRILRNFL
ncbi:MAG: 2Fe-2S iron-sulfur cluster-binding protein [Quisquiliibacterium sp.]